MSNDIKMSSILTAIDKASEFISEADDVAKYAVFVFGESGTNIDKQIAITTLFSRMETLQKENDTMTVMIDHLVDKMAELSDKIDKLG